MTIAAQATFLVGTTSAYTMPNDAGEPYGAHLIDGSHPINQVYLDYFKPTNESTSQLVNWQYFLFVILCGSCAAFVCFATTSFKPVIRAVQMTVGGVAGWYRQTLDGSFSSVSRPIFASKYSFFSIFRDLHDYPHGNPVFCYFSRPLHSFLGEINAFFQYLNDYVSRTLFFCCYKFVMDFSRNFRKLERF